VIAGVCILTLLQLQLKQCFIDFNDELAGGTMPIARTTLPYWKDAIRLGSVFCDTKSKKNDKGGDGFVDKEPFINKRKQSSTTVE
jgi:hypothetical protein